jgi:ankyrin repeat protein
VSDNVKSFFAAIQSGDLAAVRASLAAQPNLANSRNEKGQSPVMVAVYSGRTEIRDALIDHGVTLDLHEAAAIGKMDDVQRIVERDPALAKSYSPDGFPVMALAAAFGHATVVRYLLGRGADVNAVASNGTAYNSLTGAAAGGHAEIVTFLLEQGADANYRYGPGYSPLLTASANGYLEIVKALLEHGADLGAATDDGKSAVNIAEERKHPEVAAFLRSRGGS